MGITISCSLLLRFFLLCLVIVGSLCSGRGDGDQTRRPAAASASILSAERGKAVDHAELDINNMSKRRVPNGPDPIHNRFVNLSQY